MLDYKEASFLGTSISQGFFDQETGKGWVIRFFELLNKNGAGPIYLNQCAQSGDQITDYWHRLCGEAIERRAPILMIENSCNDLIRRGGLDQPHDISASKRMSMWDKIVTVAKQNFDQIYIFSALPMNEKRMPETRTDDWVVWYKNSDIEAYNNEVKKLADNNNIPFIDLYNELNHEAYLSTLDDAVHPNTKGHEIIAQTAYTLFQNIESKEKIT